jgi:hypothetical protein
VSFFCAILLRPKGMRRQPDGDSFSDFGNHFRRAFGWPSFAKPPTLADGMCWFPVQALCPRVTLAFSCDQAIVSDFQGVARKMEQLRYMPATRSKASEQCSPPGEPERIKDERVHCFQ